MRATDTIGLNWLAPVWDMEYMSAVSVRPNAAPTVWTLAAPDWVRVVAAPDPMVTRAAVPKNSATVSVEGRGNWRRERWG